ncbi:MAG: DUF2247 family protein [Microthrixaceae bacterium]
MTDDALIKFRIPAEFVVSHGLPTAAELAYGYLHKWVLGEDVVAIALRKYEAKLPLREGEEALALLLSDEYDQVDDLVDELQCGDQPEEQRARYWMFLALAWLQAHPELAKDPFEAIELLYADFDFPSEIQGLVRYMPSLPGVRTGLDAIRQRWAQYVDSEASKYRRRETEML